MTAFASRRMYILAFAAALLVTPALADAKARPAQARAKAAAKSPAKPTLPATVVPTEPGLLPDMVLGNINAPVTVIEYASASCPHCAAWNADVWPQFRDKYVATGKVKYIFREILTSPQEYALSAFLIGRCAVARSKTPQNAAPYFTVVNAFFKGQESYYKTQLLTPVQQEVTKATGLDPMQQIDCVSNEAQMTAFYKTMEAHATADGVHTTPTFVVNGKRIAGGHELKDLDEAIAAAAKP